MPDAAVEWRVPYQACPLCDSPRLAHLLRADCSTHRLFKAPLPPVIDWLKCAECSHVFTDGYFTEAALKVVFSGTHPQQVVGADFERHRMLSARMVARVARHADSGAWLDVGFGNGSLLLTAAEWGYHPIGLDLRAENVEGLRAIGIEGHASALEAFQPAGLMKVISLADVLEHLPFPRQALAAAHRLLDRDGVLLVSLPAYDSPMWRLLDAAKANPYWGEIEHYHNFSRPRLQALLEDTGFEFMEYGVSERYRACMEIIARPRAQG